MEHLPPDVRRCKTRHADQLLRHKAGNRGSPAAAPIIIRRKTRQCLLQLRIAKRKHHRSNARKTSSQRKIEPESRATFFLACGQFFRSEELKQELNDIDSLTEKRLDELLDMFLKDFEAGEVDARGWPAEFSSYKVAKAAVNAYSRILAKRHPELRINCAHPGYVRTDITRNSGILTPEEGARNITSVVLLPKEGPTGAYFHEGSHASSFV